MEVAEHLLGFRCDPPLPFGGDRHARKRGDLDPDVLTPIDGPQDKSVPRLDAERGQFVRWVRTAKPLTLRGVEANLGFFAFDRFDEPFQLLADHRLDVDAWGVAIGEFFLERCRIKGGAFEDVLIEHRR